MKISMKLKNENKILPKPKWFCKNCNYRYDHWKFVCEECKERRCRDCNTKLSTDKKDCWKKVTKGFRNWFHIRTRRHLGRTAGT